MSFLVVATTACGEDPCYTLCQSLAEAIHECDEAWDVGDAGEPAEPGSVFWEALGAQSRYDWRVHCQTEWDAVRAELEAREVRAAEDQCTDAADELTEMRAEADGACDELRVLYLE